MRRQQRRVASGVATATMAVDHRSRRGWPSGWCPGGLAFNEEKTRVVHLDDGVDFLGFSVRRCRGKLLIKPGKAAVTGAGTAQRRSEGAAWP